MNRQLGNLMNIVITTSKQTPHGSTLKLSGAAQDDNGPWQAATPPPRPIKPNGRCVISDGAIWVMGSGQFSAQEDAELTLD